MAILFNVYVFLKQSNWHSTVLTGHEPDWQIRLWGTRIYQVDRKRLL